MNSHLQAFGGWRTTTYCMRPSNSKSLLFKRVSVDIYLSWWNPVRESCPTMATRSACSTFWLRCQQDTSDKMTHPRSSPWAAMGPGTITSSGPSFLLWRWVIFDAVLLSPCSPFAHWYHRRIALFNPACFRECRTAIHPTSAAVRRRRWGAIYWCLKPSVHACRAKWCTVVKLTQNYNNW